MKNSVFETVSGRHQSWPENLVPIALSESSLLYQSQFIRVKKGASIICRFAEISCTFLHCSMLIAVRIIQVVIPFNIRIK